MSETRIREEICRLGRSLFERGLTPGSSGNISVKLDDGGWLVTPTNASLGSLDPARRSEVAMPNPIEPSPMTATRGLADSGMRRSLNVSFLTAIRSAALPLGYHGLAALPKRGKRLKETGLSA